ncbi:MAG: sigma-70 family RNA polymerase sigma factor [Oscillospiraceae bacterium]|nr:sigma-70 family RNA polymerase sigma factor [Oscillospiraceae bacterium]
MSLDAAAIAELTGRAQQGSEDAFNELYRLTRDRAYFVAFSIARNEEDALDILQETYLRAWQNLHTIENPALFDPWLRRVTGNAAKNYVKKRKPKLFDRKDNEADFLEELPDEEKYEPAAEMDNEETRRLILELVDELPEDQRLCVLMRYYGDMDVTEIAEALDIPYETAKSRLRYGKKKISDGVEALEKKGTKLHGAAPLPLLAWALRGTAKASGAKLPSVILKDGAVAAGGAAVSGGGVLAAMSLPKIIAGVAAAVVIGGGSITGVVIARS